MKRTACWLTLALAFGLIRETPAQPPTETNFFPIMPWNWMPDDLAVLKRVRDCGFTVAGFVAPGALDACQAVGLKAIVSDARASGHDWAHLDEAAARRKIASLVAEVGPHPSVFGYY